jgi:hypothetical protein
VDLACGTSGRVCGKIYPTAGDSQTPFLVTQQTPMVWSFKTKDLEGDLGQVFEE